MVRKEAFHNQLSKLITNIALLFIADIHLYITFLKKCNKCDYGVFNIMDKNMNCLAILIENDKTIVLTGYKKFGRYSGRT